MIFILKRLFDVIVSLISIFVLFPLLGFIAVLIKVESSGPLLFKQERVGQNGKIFTIYKFRTMINHAVSQGLQLGTSSTDPRVTKSGKFLREYHLDELPQLVNILLGDMSLVGPRPTLPYQISRYSERQKMRHLVRPGLTGLAQISGNNELDWDERIEKDLEYVAKKTFWSDIVILLKTFQTIIKKQGLYGKDGLVHDKKDSQSD